MKTTTIFENVKAVRHSFEKSPYRFAKRHAQYFELSGFSEIRYERSYLFFEQKERVVLVNSERYLTALREYLVSNRFVAVFLLLVHMYGFNKTEQQLTLRMCYRRNKKVVSVVACIYAL